MYLRIVISIVFFLYIVNGCSRPTEQEDLEAETHIISYYKGSNFGQKIYVKYQIENICEDSIRGWNIYFRVSMESGKQVLIHDGLTYDLEPGEVSDNIIAYSMIPDHFDDVDSPIMASLKRLEIY